MDDSVENITDIEEARRLIAALRQQIGRMVEDAVPLPGQFVIHLDKEHVTMLNKLFGLRKLIDEQAENDEWEFEDALDVFVEGWLDVRWDLMSEADDLPLIVPSA